MSLRYFFFFECETAKCDELQEVANYIAKSWPQKQKQIANIKAAEYFIHRESLSLICFGFRFDKVVDDAFSFRDCVCKPFPRVVAIELVVDSVADLELLPFRAVMRRRHANQLKLRYASAPENDNVLLDTFNLSPSLGTYEPLIIPHQQQAANANEQIQEDNANKSLYEDAEANNQLQSKWRNQQSQKKSHHRDAPSVQRSDTRVAGRNSH
ncbi:phage-associated helicase [Lasius niger]|uniref:Phage-associated helicase n=1 Tax=Lasius niger TaxID=67767 RepID=A0A0J7L7B4_LASNI|nr:phage-associated helicase [Lasius niger]